MIVRDAAADDLDGLTVMGRKFFTYSDLAAVGLSYTDEGAKRYFKWLLEITSGVIVVAENERQELQGMIGGAIGPWMGNAQQRILAECFFWLEKEARNNRTWKELIAAFERRGKELGAQFVSVGTIPKRGDAIKRIYELAGYRHIETFMIKEV